MAIRALVLQLISILRTSVTARAPFRLFLAGFERIKDMDVRYMKQTYPFEALTVKNDRQLQVSELKNKIDSK